MRALRRQRLYFILFLIGASCLAGYLIITALDENLNLFISPTQLHQEKVKAGARLRLGGVVKNESLRQEGLHIEFSVTDFNEEVQVFYTGILPDLFKEGQGIVALGVWDGESFRADQVLAKHDENYMPPEVKQLLSEEVR